MKTIHKSAAIIIRNGLLLMVRKRGTNVFISPGGKPEGGESHYDCLKREIAEELSVEISNIRPFGTFTGISQFEHRQIVLETSWVDILGTPNPGQEIEAIAWIDSNYERYGMQIGTIFKDHVIPSLVRQGLLYDSQ